MVESERHQDAQVSHETRCHITFIGADARRIATVVRSHCGVEIQLLRVLDVTFHEDESQVQRDHIPAAVNTLRQLALNLLRRESTRASIKRKRFNAALDDCFRANIVFGLCLLFGSPDFFRNWR